MNSDRNGHVVAVHCDAEHRFSKQQQEEITLIAGLGVEGDAHAGAQVRHRSRVAKDPTQPNLRQIHLVASELLDEVREAGHDIVEGQLGENITTVGLDLVALPTGTVLRVGGSLIALTGLRNPCKQINAVGNGVLKMMFVDGEHYGRPGGTVGRAGVMGVVVSGGVVQPGDSIAVSLPPEPHLPMESV